MMVLTKKLSGRYHGLRVRHDMVFERWLRGALCSKVPEQMGVMSIDSLDRQWVFVTVVDGYLIAKSKDGKAVLMGRMGKRDDGKFCIEVSVRAEIENKRLRNYELWHVDPADGYHHVRRLDEVLQAAPA